MVHPVRGWKDIKKIKKYLINDNGQILPFLAVVILIMLLFAAWGIGRSWVFSDRMRVRDALDAAAHATMATVKIIPRPTYYGEYLVEETDDEGNVVSSYWVRYESDYKDRMELSYSEADAEARVFFNENMIKKGVDGYRILDWQLTLDQENRPLQVHKDRPNTEGTIASWQENFPRWYEVTINARVEVPVPMGNITDQETMVVSFPVTAETAMRGIIPHQPNPEEGGDDDGWH